METDYGNETNEMDEIARLVQQAEASVMQQFQPDSNRTDALPTNDFEHFHDISHDTSHDVPHGISHDESHDVSHGLPTFEPTIDHQTSTPIDNVEPRPESLWSNPRDFTRRKHIIPALGSLVSVIRDSHLYPDH